MNSDTVDPQERDTYTWLLTLQDACPTCGAPLGPEAPGCAACGRSLLILVRPPQRSLATTTLIGMWVFGMLGATLALIGTLSQLLGVTQRANSAAVLRWLLFGSAGGAIFSAIMAWGCWSRRPFALYLGIALSALLGVAGVAAGLLLKGAPALALVAVGLLAAIGLILTHIATAHEFRGEWRRQAFAPRATSGKGLYLEGHEYYQAGLHFLAAQRWARALGKEPSNAAYMHALALALAQLGHQDRALGQIERALRADPGNPEIRESYEIIRKHVVRSR